MTPEKAGIPAGFSYLKLDIYRISGTNSVSVFVSK